MRLDRTRGDDAVDAEAARATLRARAASSNVASRASRSPRSAPARARPFPPARPVAEKISSPLDRPSQAYWRIAGMSYLKYSNMCAEVVRASLKEPFFTKVRPQSLPPRRSTRLGTRVSDFLARPDPTRRR